MPYGGTGDEWDAHLSTLEGGSFCHLWAWGDVIREALSHDTSRWVAVDQAGTVHGLLPLTLVRSRLFGSYLVSMPFLSYGGPIGSPEAQELLARTAVDQARELGVDLLELRSRHPIPGDLATSDRKITVVKPLGSSPEELWEGGLKSKVRSQIRRPMKEGMTPSFGPELVDDFYSVFSTTMRDLGTPVLPRRFFEAIAERLGEHAIFCVIRHDDQPVAAGCGFAWRDEFEITWAGASREFSRLSPNMLLYWSLMEESVRRGLKEFNFGRCSPDSGTHRFKMQWGSREEPLPWAQWSPSGLAATPSPTGTKYRLATNVWARLPVWLTNAVGPSLARLLP